MISAEFRGISLRARGLEVALLASMIASKTSSEQPKRLRSIHAKVESVVHNRKVVAQIGGPKVVLAALQSIADALVI